MVPPFTVKFTPAFPVAGEPITATVASTFGPSCLPPATSVDSSRETITLRLDFGDTCATGTPVAIRNYALGSYPAGPYAFSLNVCTDNPPPLPSPCVVEFATNLGITLVRLDSVPALLPVNICAMVASIAIVGLIGLCARNRLRKVD